MSEGKASARGIHWAIFLAVVAGYVDALAYLTQHAFVSNMTGNTVLLGIALCKQQWDQAMRPAEAVGAFLAGVVAARLMLRGGLPGRFPLLGTAALLAAAAGSPAAFALPALAAAMGLQNAAITEFDMVPINTAFITGDLQRLGQAIGDRPSGSPRRTIVALASVWTCYLGGAALGAVAPGFILLPIGLPVAVNAALLVGAIGVALISVTL